MGLIKPSVRFEVWNMSGNFRLRFPLWGSFVFVFCAVFNQGCWVFIQYNLLDGCCKWILIEPWTQVLDYLLLGITWHIRLRIVIFLLSISETVVHGRCYISYCFYFSVFLMIVCWLIFVLCFYVSISLDSSLSNKEPILTFLFFFLINH